MEREVERGVEREVGGLNSSTRCLALRCKMTEFNLRCYANVNVGDSSDSPPPSLPGIGPATLQPLNEGCAKRIHIR